MRLRNHDIRFGIMAKKIHLVAYLKAGPSARYPSTWCHPSASLDDLFRPERWEHIARTLEAARFDAFFFADGLGIPNLYKDSFDDFLGRGSDCSTYGTASGEGHLDRPVRGVASRCAAPGQDTRDLRRSTAARHGDIAALPRVAPSPTPRDDRARHG